MNHVRGIPVPDILQAWLPSDGTNRATLHDYVATVEIPSLRDGHRSYEFQFQCAMTGAIRRWGIAHVELH